MEKTYIVVSTQVTGVTTFENPPEKLSVIINELDADGVLIKSVHYMYSLSVDEVTNLEILLDNAMIAYKQESGFV
jgi:hypothetical protein